MFENHKSSPQVQFLVMILALIGFYYVGSKFVDENRLNFATKTTIGHVTGKKNTRRANLVYYDYLCEGDACHAGQQAVSSSYYRRLQKGDAVTITYLPQKSNNLTRIEKRPVVYFFSLITMAYMLGTFLIYVQMYRSYRNRQTRHLMPPRW